VAHVVKNWLFALALLAASPACLGANLEKIATEAQATGQPAITVWVASTWGFRTEGSATKLNEAHRVFAQHGYEVVSVEPYIENGDLEGFFVTYRRKG
jgi:hypothetical protein